MTPTIDLLRSHRSIRHFTDDAISDAQREAIIAVFNRYSLRISKQQAEPAFHPSQIAAS